VHRRDGINGSVDVSVDGDVNVAAGVGFARPKGHVAVAIHVNDPVLMTLS
jgi:hypothetical protein